MTTTHIMLDLETWGTEPGCDIRSIGACVFDPVTGVVGNQHDPYPQNHEFYIACDNPSVDTFCSPDGRGGYIDHPHHGERFKSKYPLTRDPRTAQWWSDQSDEAQAAFADPVDLKVALERFSSWIINMYPAPWNGELTPDIRLWSHGPQFDISILAAVYRVCDLPVPWHYRAPRDTRTCFDMAGIDDHSTWLKQHPGPLGIPHHALDDAICQARAVCAAYDALRNDKSAAVSDALDWERSRD